MSALDSKLAEVAHQYDDVQAQLALPETSADIDAIRRLGRELARLEPVVEAYRRLLDTRSELAGAREMRDAEGDEELRTMARDEVDRLEATETRLVEELKVLLLPRDPAEEGKVIVEIRAGAGGEEAALFAAELLRMYLRYAERHRLKPEVMSLHETGIGGVKEAIVQINPAASAVRITPLPSGLVVEIQDEKSQHKNKAKAMAVLRARLQDAERRRQREADSVARKSMIGSGDRADKIRTYNFPQDRVTDHRVNMDLSSLPRVMDGDLDRLIDTLITTDQAERLAAFVEADPSGG